jgi:hypothetical protein
MTIVLSVPPLHFPVIVYTSIAGFSSMAQLRSHERLQDVTGSNVLQGK